MPSGGEAGLGRRELTLVAAAWAAMAALFIILNGDAIAAMSLPDSDDHLRLQQVRDWIAGQAWFDVTQHRINPPEGGLLHWSRLVDIPIALGILALTPLVGQTSAEQIVAVTLPLAIMGLAMWLTAAVAARLVDRTWAPLAAAAIPLSALIYLQIMPLRLDHHGWQIVLALVLFWALLDETHKWRSGVIAAIASACWLNISLEGLPVVTCAALLLGARWLEDSREAPRLQAYLWTLALASAALETLTTSLPWVSIECDRISRPYLFAFGVAAAAALGLQARIFKHDWRMRLTFGAVAGAAVGATFLNSGAQCFAGPFVALEPLARTLWLEKVAESQPLLQRGAGAFIANGGFWAVGLAGAIWAWRRSEGEARMRWTTAVTMIAVSGAMMFVLTRTGGVAHAFAAAGAVFIGHVLFRRARALGSMPLRAVLTALALAIATPALLRPALKLDHTTRAVGTSSSCASDTLAALPRGIVFAPVDMGAAALTRTDHSVVATPHHRNHRAISDVLLAFTAAPDAAFERISAHRADYVALCPHTTDVRSYINAAPDGLAAQLVARRIPDWLHPLDIAPQSDGLLIFGIDASSAQDDLRGRLAFAAQMPAS